MLDINPVSLKEANAFVKELKRLESSEEPIKEEWASEQLSEDKRNEY